MQTKLECMYAVRVVGKCGVGQKCRARHTACKTKKYISERQAEAIRILHGVLDVLASVITKDMPRTKRLNKLYHSAAKYIKQLNIVELRHLVCT